MQKRVTEPAINGLYARTWEVCEYPAESRHSKPTYIMNRENFEVFVTGLEKLAKQAEKVFKSWNRNFDTTKPPKITGVFTREMEGNKDFNRFIQAQPLDAVDNSKILNVPKSMQNFIVPILCAGNEHSEFIKKYERFVNRYNEMFTTVVQQHEGKEYFNLEFYPRHKGKEQSLFTKFLNAFFCLQSIKRLNIRRPSKTIALTLEEQTTNDDLRRKGKGTERGSIRFCAEEIRLKRKCSPKREPALRRAICRHNRRIKESHQS